MSNNARHIWIADDDNAARVFLQQAVAGLDNINEQAFEGGDPLLEALPDAPQVGVVISDVSMPGMNGIDLTKAVTKKAPWVPVILISGEADLPTAIQGMHAGAVYFLEKPCSIKDVQMHTSMALETASTLTENWQQHLDAITRIARLTPREREVAEQLCAGLSNKQVAIALELSPRTIEIHRSHIMMRTHCESFAELVRIWIRAQRKPGQQQPF